MVFSSSLGNRANEYNRIILCYCEPCGTYGYVSALIIRIRRLER